MASASLLKLILFLHAVVSLYGYQIFLPVQDNADSIFSYQMMGAGGHNGLKFTIKSVFDLHIRNDSQNRQLKLHIINPSGTAGKDEWTDDVITALMIPFNITLDADGHPEKVHCEMTKETNYTLARKQLILQHLQDIYFERTKCVGKILKDFVSVLSMPKMPFGTCKTSINASLSDVYYVISYESRRDNCEGTVDPYFTMDMNVDLYPQSEFLKAYGFTKRDLDFQFFRLEALVKLQSTPEMDVEIYTFLTLKEILTDPEPENEVVTETVDRTTMNTNT